MYVPVCAQGKGVTQAYTLQVRTRLFSSTGPATALQWTYIVCAATEFTVFASNDSDSVSCIACPAGGDCSGAITASALTDASTSSAAVVLQNVRVVVLSPLSVVSIV